jgi:hypothetical protein
MFDIIRARERPIASSNWDIESRKVMQLSGLEDYDIDRKLSKELAHVIPLSVVSVPVSVKSSCPHVLEPKISRTRLVTSLVVLLCAVSDLLSNEALPRTSGSINIHESVNGWEITFLPLVALTIAVFSFSLDMCVLFRANL